jgi:hypothetical protein
MGFAGVVGFSDGSLFPDTLVAQASNCNIKGTSAVAGNASTTFPVNAIARHPHWAAQG